MLALAGCPRCAASLLSRERVAHLEELLLNARRELLSTRRELNIARRELGKRPAGPALVQPPVHTAAPEGLGHICAQRPGVMPEPRDGSAPAAADLPPSAGPTDPSPDRPVRAPRRLHFDESNGFRGDSANSSTVATPRSALSPRASGTNTPQRSQAPSAAMAKSAGLASASGMGSRLGSASGLSAWKRGSASGRGGSASGTSARRPPREHKAAAATTTLEKPRRPPVGLQTLQTGQWAASALTQLQKSRLRKARAHGAATALQAVVRGNAARGIATRRWLEAQCGSLAASLDLTMTL